MERFALATLLLTVTALTVSAQHPYSRSPYIAASSQPTMAEILEASDGVKTVAGRRLKIYGGHEFGWLMPRFSNNVSAVVSQSGGNHALSFEHDDQLTSRVWLGMENDRCNGLRARYWYFDAEAPTQVNFATPGAAPISLTIQGAGGNLSRTAQANAGDALTSDHRIEMRTIDLEITRRLRSMRGDVLAAFGLRYAKTHQRAHAVATDPGGSLTELVCQDTDFQGFGPTLSGEFARPICRFLFCRSQLSFYANARSSLLFGEQEQEIVLVTGGGATLAEDQHLQDDFLPIIEIGGGLRWTACPTGRWTWVTKTGYRAESWFSAGGPVDVDSNIALHGMLLSIAAIY